MVNYWFYIENKDICKIYSNIQYFDERPVKAFLDELFGN